jgi:hypothetical protein
MTATATATVKTTTMRWSARPSNSWVADP